AWPATSALASALSLGPGQIVVSSTVKDLVGRLRDAVPVERPSEDGERAPEPEPRQPPTILQSIAVGNIGIVALLVSYLPARADGATTRTRPKRRDRESAPDRQ